MNKADLTEILASRGGIPKVRAANYINIFTEAIQESLVRGEKVTISDFGHVHRVASLGVRGAQPQERGADVRSREEDPCLSLGQGPQERPEPGLSTAAHRSRSAVRCVPAR